MRTARQSAPLDIPLPLKGQNTNWSVDKQSPETSRLLKNMVPQNPKTGRVQMSTRCGRTPYMTGFVNGSGVKVAELATVTHSVRHIDYEAATQPEEMWAKVLDSGATVSALQAGPNDDVFYVENNTQLVRLNRYGVEQCRLDIPDVGQALVGGFTVGVVGKDENGSIFVATSGQVAASVGNNRCRLWKYVQDPVNRELYKLQWSIIPNGSLQGRVTVRVRCKDGQIYALERETIYVKIRRYTNVTRADGPMAAGEQEILTEFGTTELAGITVGAQQFPHDMALHTNAGLKFVVCGGNSEAAVTASAGVVYWIVKVGPNGTTANSRPYGILANYNIQNDGTTVTANTRGGGIGFGCEVNTIGNVISIGANGGDDAWVRHIIDTGTAWSTNVAGTWLRASATDLGGAGTDPAYGYPRFEIDTWGNPFVPTCLNAAGVAAALVLKADGTVFVTIDHQVLVASVLTATNNECRTVAISVTYPTFEEDDYKSAEVCFLGGSAVKTLQSGTGNASVHGYNILTAEYPSSARPTRRVTLIAICGGGVFVVTPAGVLSPTNNTSRTPPLDAGASFYQAVEIYSKLYLFDGVNSVVYDPKPTASDPNGTLEDLTASGLGVVPQRPRLAAEWLGSLILARTADQPFSWWKSETQNPRGWDFGRSVTLATQAVGGTNAIAGEPPDQINALIVTMDDQLVAGGDHSIRILRGNPIEGGRFDMLSRSTGIAFGSPHCMDPRGNIYFLGSRGGIYVLGRDGSVVWLTEHTIENELASINMTTHFVRLVWSTKWDGLFVYLMPYGAGGTHVKHWFWSAKYGTEGGWFPVEFGTDQDTTAQPTAAVVMDGDEADDRIMVEGTEDGRVLFEDPDASDDDGTPIDWRMLVGPIAPEEADMVFRYTRPSVVLNQDLGGASVRFYASDDGELPDRPVSDIRIGPGRNERLPIRAKAPRAYMELRSASRVGGSANTERCAVESMSVFAAPAGRKRTRAYS